MNLKSVVVEPPILTVFKEVGVAVAVAHRVVDVVGNAFPVGNGLGVGFADRRRFLRIELVKLGPFEEVDFLVAAPNEGRVHVVGNPFETFPDLFGITVVHLPAPGEPVILGALEEVRLAVGPRERGVDVGRESVPIPGDGSRISVGDGIVRQLPILTAFEGVSHLIFQSNDGVDGGVVAKFFIVVLLAAFILIIIVVFVAVDLVSSGVIRT